MWQQRDGLIHHETLAHRRSHSAESIRLNGGDLASLDEKEIERVRGNEVLIIFFIRLRRRTPR
jgi:ABC-type microcin C transport system duplicated ATPase subunit YejF